ncbi:pyrroloquinoline quinone biosynthesis protein PqqB [Erwinia sp. OLTSP20]|uniref:pyrroloquinoline quinone biosynthesis protein PqqB n=1 Tax=unclassified Erwinia TaxID=2622719 RepID=UPI000C19D1A9|nr:MULTISPECIES: pyrroloquinoline quinone biosynthesis protein PqqB [unclassified Erwinia]PIJ50714.1 pyrroloquinoline quinone biosynthesis protein PqqB [Erwinia sp. OAMSP11]PIJ75384.1 pyrroloquinoline quinone biosynthesis protein PqqB [Erwinia sp. OLSSP12]PIJ81882.1 pyrroloquinoline quinone biosynthesis protein PqqB [Erwinia sp. OLCASP19]PIJ84537.1 pyrroloquinoline quinone biosynthesis protein PqqB [Erwinia sp. OLMTSP26]PIJ86884.1 pyrroloquinoline quinone biosynthesis protein PqqB [Erwinia sp.
MFIKVLGSAAGGGFPQWNCNCKNCRGVRDGSMQTSRRTQSSIALSDDGENWILCNVSPDICHQLLASPELHNPRVLRGSAIGAIILTDSQIDHCAGLLNLREGCPHQVWCTPEVHDDLSSGFPLFTILSHWNGGLHYHPLTPQESFNPGVCPAISITAIPLLSNAPPYSRFRHKPLAGHNIALYVEDGRSGKSLLYAPGLGEPDAGLLAWMRRADCLLVDGTLWTDNELETSGVNGHSGKEMGHLALGDAQGLVSVLTSLPAARKILIHINNTNPILDEASCQRRSLMQRGIEVSYDGMMITL